MDRIEIRTADILDTQSIMNVTHQCAPAEIYNLAAQSHVRVSYDQASYTAQVNGMAVLNLLDRLDRDKIKTRFYQASTSEMFGNCADTDGFQRETTQMLPVSPYGIAKLFAHHVCRHYRTAHDMFISCGILFNHESFRRGDNFVTKKITNAIVEIKNSRLDMLKMGNLNSCRDWGHAKDYVYAMWLMLQHDTPDDFIVSTGITHSVYDFATKAFNLFDLDFDQYYIKDPDLYRAEELTILKGDSSKIRKQLGWEPTYTYEEIIESMF